MKKATMKNMQTRVYESVVALKNVLAENGGEVVAERLEWSGCSINDLEEESKNLINLYERGNMADKIAFRAVMTKGCWYYNDNAWQFFMPATRDCMEGWRECRKSLNRGKKLGVTYCYDDPNNVYAYSMTFTLDGKEMFETVPFKEEYYDDDPGTVLYDTYDTFPTATDF